MPFVLRASAVNVGVTPRQPVPELAGPREAGIEVERGIPGFDGLFAGVDRGFGEDILGIAVAVV